MAWIIRLSPHFANTTFDWCKPFSRKTGTMGVGHAFSVSLLPPAASNSRFAQSIARMVSIKYFQDKLLRLEKRLSLMPGGGAGSLDTVIRLYVGWGREFIILLDSDSEGVAQRARYRDLFGVLVQDRIFTLVDIDPSWAKRGMERLVEESDRLLIQQTSYPSTKKFNKTHFNRAIQELYLTNQTLSLSSTTIAKFEKVLVARVL